MMMTTITKVMVNDDDANDHDGLSDVPLQTANLKSDESASIFIVEVDFDLGGKCEKKAGSAGQARRWSQLA